MKINILIIFILLVCGCKSKDSFYGGYIYSHENRPLVNVKVFEIDSIKNFTYTDLKGCFYLKRHKNWLSDLVIIYDNKLDTVRTVGNQGGEKINYFLIDSYKDTIFIKEKIKIEVHKN